MVGIVVLLAGFSQPIVLLVISAVVGGFMMFIYSGLLILINRKILPAPIRVRGWRLAGLVWSILLFGDAVRAHVLRPDRQALRRRLTGGQWPGRGGTVDQDPTAGPAWPRPSSSSRRRTSSATAGGSPVVSTTSPGSSGCSGSRVTSWLSSSDGGM